jgi:hypothetical protein
MDVSEIRKAKELGTAPTSFIEKEEPEIKKKKKKFFSFRVSKSVIALLFIGGTVGAYFQGYLDPVLNSPQIKQEIEVVSEMIRPYLLTLAEKVPALSHWISPLPHLEDVSPEEYEDLKIAAKDNVEAGGPRVALALARGTPLFPAFYVSSNLPDGAQFHIYVIGKSDTLLDQLSFGSQVDVTISKKLGKSSLVRYADGKPIPRGEYTVYLTSAEVQPVQVKSYIAALSGITTNIPSELPKNLKVIAQKVYFLGGNKDASYLERLREYHNKLQLKAANELNEIRQFALTLESQLESTKVKFGLLRKGKITPKQRQLWDAFHVEWMKLQGQLDQIFMNWSPEVIQAEFFYGMLYALVHQVGQDIEKVHGFHHSYFNGVQDLKTFDIQLGAALSSAESSLSLLKSKGDQARSMQPTLNGMPRKDGL